VEDDGGYGEQRRRPNRRGRRTEGGQTTGQPARGDHGGRGAQHFPVRDGQFGDSHQPVQVAAGVPDRQRHPGPLAGQVAGHPVRLQIGGDDQLAAVLPDHLRGQPGEAADERVGHRDVREAPAERRFRAVHRHRPAVREGGGVVAGRAPVQADPVRVLHLGCVRHHEHLVAATGQARAAQ
jgi:hypothetical protein